MLYKIVILGSTGSIGKSVLDIVNKDKSHFKIRLLSCNKNYKKLLKQAIKFKVKNLIITDYKSFKILKKKENIYKIKVFNNFDCFKKIFKSKNDLIFSAISGLSGLHPTLQSIPFTKKILIANKESIICGWNLIKKKLIKNMTDFIPIDSEHFSIWSLLTSKNNVDKVYITASGGPFYRMPLKQFNKITPRNALKHPTWKMGKKISIDSSTLINKVFEVIEAKNIFNLKYKDIKILIHPKSYLHAIIKYKNGIIKFLAHDTSMKIPIFNSIYYNVEKKINTENLNIDKLNNLNLSKVDDNKFPSIKILKLLPKNISLYETVLVSANDELVNLFLQNRISYKDIIIILFKVLRKKEFIIFKKIRPKSIDEILNLAKLVRFKVRSLSI